MSERSGLERPRRAYARRVRDPWMSWSPTVSLAHTLARWRARLTGEAGPEPTGPSVAAQLTEQDVGHDPRTVASRATGGAHSELSGDRGSTTGTGETGVFVGQVAGDDPGYAEETGAEARARAEGGNAS